MRCPLTLGPAAPGPARRRTPEPASRARHAVGGVRISAPMWAAAVDKWRRASPSWDFVTPWSLAASRMSSRNRSSSRSRSRAGSFVPGMSFAQPAAVSASVLVSDRIRVRGVRFGVRRPGRARQAAEPAGRGSRGLTGLGGRRAHLDAQLARRDPYVVTDLRRQFGDRIADLQLQIGQFAAAPGQLGAAGVGDRVDLAAALGGVGDQALGLQFGQSRIDGAGGRRVQALETFLQKPDHLVTVAWGLVQEPQQVEAQSAVGEDRRHVRAPSCLSEPRRPVSCLPPACR